jgi:hypothetical protein
MTDGWIGIFPRLSQTYAGAGEGCAVLDAARLQDRANAEIQMAQAASQHF